jgi:NAD(P)H-dependent flavin oxidoreductase YrpB (nitropropane dioxygenase family)
VITSLLNTKYPLIITHPPLVIDRDYFRAIAQSGALPLLDTEFMQEEDIIDTVRSMDKDLFAYGIKISVAQKPLLERLIQDKPVYLDLIVLTYDSPDQFTGFSCDSNGTPIFVEARDIDLPSSFSHFSPDGLILKGYEAGGRVSGYTAFILMQWYLEHADIPLFIHGGVGLHTAAGMMAAGVSGLVLDSQLYLCDEAPLSASFKDLIKTVTETDTSVVGETLGTPYRFFARLGTRIVKTLKETESRLVDTKNAASELYKEIKTAITPMDKPVTSPLQSLFYLGQDASFAASFLQNADGSRSITDVIRSFFLYIGQLLGDVDIHDPLIEHSPLAKEHGTRYPVIQGPMANISDNPAFAEAVYTGGGLPFFAMGNLPAHLSENMLSEGKKRVPRFGAGLIGIETFNRTIHTHLDQIKHHQVPFALFAGGIPAQVNELEKAGTKTYLHTPNMMMLDNAIENGCKRFIFEGTEAGGHVGSLTSMVLWESAMNRLMKQDEHRLGEQTVIFAGGISTAHASAFVSGLSSSLARKGTRIGIQVGSAYLFTNEIVALKSIGTLYQNTLTSARKTIVTGNTVGLPSRTVPTPFARKLMENEHRRVKDGMGLTDRKTAFEEENLGSLLISAKGFLPDIHGKNKGELLYFTETEQFEKGNFLVGDSLAFLEPGLTIADIHHRYFHEKNVLFNNLNRLEALTSPDNQINDEIAVIGAGCVLPDAPNPEALWQNVITGRYSITTMPEDRLNPDLFYNEDRQAEDKTYTRMAGVVRDFTFDHEAFGFTDDQAATMSRTQKMLLTAARQAVRDSGPLTDDSGRTAVIVASCLGNEQGNDLLLKYYYPEIRAHLETLDSFNTLSADQKKDRKSVV